jgi:uncharacterized phage infection (PIP) family protein YhgE
MKQGVTAAVVLFLGTWGFATAEARDGSPYSRKEVEKVIDRAEEKCNGFKELTEEKLNGSILKGTRIAANINRAAQELDDAIDRLKKKFDRDDKLKETRDEAADVYDAAQTLESALEDVRRGSEIWDEWKALKKDIDALVEAYGLTQQE